MKSKVLLLPLFILGLIFVALAWGTKSAKINKLKPTPTPAPLYNLTVSSTTIKVEMANTPELRQLGLSYRASMPNDNGMLFDFEQKDVPATFWMKGMEFPLDFVWINDGKVTQIMENAEPQAGNLQNYQYKLYSPDEPVDYVLEVNAGFVKSHNIKVGEPVAIPD